MTSLWCYMNRKLVLLTVFLAVLSGMLFSTVVSAEISVGVQEGDWIEYQVTSTGDVPEDHNVEGGKLEIINVKEKTIFVNITSIYYDGTEETLPYTFNLETGQIGDAFIIPANLDSGDEVKRNENNITISGIEEKTIAGAKRSVLYATTSDTSYYWDRATGVLVEATSTYTDFTLTTKAKTTNMWQPQIFGLDPIAFFVLLIVAVVAVLAIFMILKTRK